MAQCTGETKTGNRCRQQAIDGDDRCDRHQRGAVKRRGNAAAAEITIRALEASFSDLDAALVEAVRSLAAAVDENPAHANLWSRYLEALELLANDDGDPDDAREVFEQFASGS